MPSRLWPFRPERIDQPIHFDDLVFADRESRSIAERTVRAPEQLEQALVGAWAAAKFAEEAADGRAANDPAFFETVEKWAEGLGPGRTLQAVLLGGAAGSFVTPAQLDVPLSFEGTRAIGATLGSGVVMLFDDAVDLQDTVLRIASFFRDESCGQCVPCRVGTVRQEEALHRLASKRPLGSADAEVALIDEVAQAMRDASICGLGQTAAGAVQSAIRKLHLFDGKGNGHGKGSA